MIWDTHAHLDDLGYKEDFLEVAARMKSAGISRLTNVGYDLPSSERSVKLAQDYDFIYAAIGVHPHNAEEATDETWEKLLGKLVKQPKVLAWGEIGLDYYRDLSPRPIQKKVFIQQIKLANEVGLPIVIHNRDAHQDVMEIVKSNPPQYGGIFHCYSGSWEMAKVLLNLGFYLSFAGPVTYKNARHTVEVAKNAPLDRILVETDSPYLTPEPRRGKRNEPTYVVEIVKKLAEIRGVPFEDLAIQTMHNAETIFRLV
ncbi:TatD family hydrolase [Desulfosporosinus sp. BICA1-9]|uniref:TatD family hydrolase n=1 Tax=Desulfosporosinus sp. BICA1-9 TaxID=1531958 RepID=UPI00054BB474|nr:TatD family hydrolase [Desulfosporosinus sp. BICA1-9]KJS46358.1 MAG: hydrolase TatD [Peptococcaceae bacterium BRH_c23]KJS89619.1 MAG: hydrolase TatD [Desulfosporosinus sp. BICA1-9]HBW39159.1 TatD family deoxyribonuclease [Desulfosporosinus sp.]